MPTCKYCKRDRHHPCMNTRDMADFAITGEFDCYDQLSERCGGEVGMRYVDANIAKNKVVADKYKARLLAEAS